MLPRLGENYLVLMELTNLILPIGFFCEDPCPIKRIRPNSSSLNSEGAPHKYTKYVIKDPFNNRKDIAKVAKNAVGFILQ